MTNDMETIRAIDHAAAMSDRWLFLATLVVMGVAIYFISRHYIRLHMDLIADFKVNRERNESNMLQIVKEQSASHARTISVIEENTKVIQQVTQTIRFCQQKNGQREERP